METTQEEFKQLYGIDLTDHEHSGVFPYYKNGKWSSISRGKAWQMYAKWLEDKSTSQKETIERLGMAIQNLYDAAFTAVSHVAVANYQSREIEAKNLIRTAYEQAEQLLSTTEPKT